MRFRNTTEIPNDWLRAAIAAVKPANVSNFEVWVKNGESGICGKAYVQGCSFSGKANPYILLRVAKKLQTDSRFNKPYHYYDSAMVGKGYLAHFYLYTRRELVLFVLAHELRHLWQSKIRKGYRVWGALGQYSERDADAYALRMVRRYRRGDLRI